MIAIIEYGAGNTASVQNAIKRLGYSSIITNNITDILKADKVILPGVGEAATAKGSLVASGLDLLLPKLDQPVLGICLGMQLLCKTSEENNTKCLGLFDVTVHQFPTGHIVPHMGWNNIENEKGDLFKGLVGSNVYFVHSYYAGLCDDTIATCNYIIPFSAAIQKRNFYGTQFHPEKSGSVGELILKNFISL